MPNTVITGPILDSFGQPVNGYLYGAQTARSVVDGALVTQTVVKSRVVDGTPFLDDGVTPLDVPSTAVEAEAFEWVEDFRPYRKQVVRYTIIPAAGPVSYGELQEVKQPAESSAWIVPGWARDLVDANAGIAASVDHVDTVKADIDTKVDGFASTVTEAQESISTVAAEIEAIDAITVRSGEVVGDNLVLTRTDESKVTAGNVRGPKGEQGNPGVNSVANDTATASQINDSASATRAALGTWGIRKYASGATGPNQEVWSDVAVRGALKGRFLGVADHIGNFRQPFGASMTYDAANLTGTSGGDKVGSQLNIIFKGDFTPDQARPGGAPKWLWGANDFIIIGDGSTPLLGITDAWSRLTEIHLRSPNMTLNNVHAMIAESGFDSTATGSTITGWLASLKASGPTNTVGATVANAASFYVTSPLAGVATNQYAIFVSGTEKSRFGGDIHLNESSGDPKNFDAHYGGFKGVTVTVGIPGTSSLARLTVKSQADADVTAWFQARGAQTGDVLRLGADTVVRSRFDKRGRLGMVDTAVPADADVATGEQMFYVATTAGAPKLMIKGKDSAGTVFIRSISLASQSGTTANRPSAATVGVNGRYYDTTLSKPIWSDGTIWRDATGAAA
ncbi:hypothetical protein C5E11_03800 [Clavibacter michiganensis]|nr:hypothetical protein [Clavibacter michiganensis]PPF64525.1 hypothetical protein C5E11_03800 [Clavibacter michiganensis]